MEDESRLTSSSLLRGSTEVEVPPRGSTFRNSELAAFGSYNELSGLDPTQRFTESARVSVINGSFRGTQTEMKLLAVEPLGDVPERKRDYKGRIRTYPGILLMLVLVLGGAALVTYGAMKVSQQATLSNAAYENRTEVGRKINDGKSDDEVLVSDDGQVGNPKKYPDMGCELPNYVSKDRQVFAVSANGTEVPVGIKGVNWFGMETGLAIPFGLWENQDNGTTAYEVAGFLARNKFNSVRLPLCIKNILEDTAPEKSLINLNTNRAVNVTTYMSTVKSIIEALGYRKISVLISLHTLDPKESGGAWFSEKLDVTEDQFLEAIDILTSNLCTSQHWNIIGLDLKNEPHECSWDGSDDMPSWKEGATLIGNRMLEGCPNWLAFIEGTSGSYPITINGRDGTYFDWWGGGLEKAGADPVEYTVPNKVVWSPHYYNTGVNPVWYLYGGGDVQENNAIVDFVELDDETLKANVKKTMDAMFGYLVEDSEYAMVMGEFAGLYSKDEHPKKTTKRSTDYTMEVMLEDNYAGSYMWSLNPESAYQYNPADTYGTFTEGLLMDDWLTPNEVFLDAINMMDATKDLRMFPCFPIEVESSSSGSSE